jgi:hypothetical protein
MQTDYQHVFRIAVATIKARWFFEIGEALTDALLDMGHPGSTLTTRKSLIRNESR